MSAGWTLGSFISSSRSTGTANRLIVIGPIVSAASLALLALLMPMAGLSQQGSANWWMLPLLGVGVGVGLCWPIILTRVFKSAPKGQENIASAAITTRSVENTSELQSLMHISYAVFYLKKKK